MIAWNCAVYTVTVCTFLCVSRLSDSLYVCRLGERKFKLWNGYVLDVFLHRQTEMILALLLKNMDLLWLPRFTKLWCSVLPTNRGAICGCLCNYVCKAEMCRIFSPGVISGSLFWCGVHWSKSIQLFPHSDILMSRSFPIGTCVWMWPCNLCSFPLSIFALPFFLMDMKHVNCWPHRVSGYFTNDGWLYGCLVRLWATKYLHWTFSQLIGVICLVAYLMFVAFLLIFSWMWLLLCLQYLWDSI